VQIGHQPGELCQFAKKGHKDFVVVHTNGIHLVNLYFCGCTSSPEPRRQLLREQWWPATVIDPQTVVTFAVLNIFHRLSLQGKVSAYDFYGSLKNATDGFGLSKPPVSTNIHTCAARQLTEQSP
jgi:hypothetical protein